MNSTVDTWSTVFLEKQNVLENISSDLATLDRPTALHNMPTEHVMAAFFVVGFCIFLQHTNGLQCLLNICGDYAAEHEIAFNCNKTSGVFFVPRSINNLVHQMLSELCTCTVIWPSQISWCIAQHLWWWYSEKSEITVLCSKQAQRHSAVGALFPRAYARGLGLKTPLSLQFYKIFITCPKEIKCFRIVFAF